MPYQDIFNDTCTNSVGGIKKLYLATRYTDGKPIPYPLPLTYVDENTVEIALDYDNRVINIYTPIAIGAPIIEFRDITPNLASLNQELTYSREGYIYQKNLTFSVPKLNITTNNQIREFLFDANGEFAISKALVLIQDNNGVDWITGFDIPFEISEFELKTDYRNGENSYLFTYLNRSYTPAIKYVNRL